MRTELEVSYLGDLSTLARLYPVLNHSFFFARRICRLDGLLTLVPQALVLRVEV